MPAVAFSPLTHSRSPSPTLITEGPPRLASPSTRRTTLRCRGSTPTTCPLNHPRTLPTERPHRRDQLATAGELNRQHSQRDRGIRLASRRIDTDERASSLGAAEDPDPAVACDQPTLTLRLANLQRRYDAM